MTIFLVTIILFISSAQAVDEEKHQPIKRSAKPFFPVHLILQAILQNQPQTLEAVKQLQRISSPSLAIKEILKPITDITSATSRATKQILQNTIIKPANAPIQNSTRVKRDRACLYGYSHNPKACDSTGTIINWFLNPVAAIVHAFRKPHDEDTEPYQRALNRSKEKFIIELQKEVRQLQAEKYPVIPVSYNEAYSTPSPTEAPTTFSSWNPKHLLYKDYLQRKQDKFIEIRRELLTERHRYLTKILQGKQAEEEGIWEKSRKRRQALPMWQRIMKDVIGTFMGNF